MKNPHKKWRDEHVLFLDDAFDCIEAFELLTAGGFRVQRFTDVFHDDDGRRLEGIKDPEIISHCNKHGMILVTTDGSIINTHRREIERSKRLGILATAHNTVEDVSVWTAALIKLKPVIERNSFRKRQRPWFSKFDKDGRFCVPARTIEPMALDKAAKR